ncbi:unnamed protein product [Acanthoscelides obtectus]|uniref:SIAH-type domain-containing protein n=1 Tax=Acanthoscelides obtectus TaxID=200917 RepID=A0A9P0PFV3_ACAOB|nr:unnamed protein product [Acanthoscelides obtectus]CAK1639221.1 hypothetical protein AOBTE_LOCUS11053 [Acanthoscelides obtectus]
MSSQYICGRCCPKAIQCSLYDAIADHLSFPCIFAGCTSMLNWGEVKEHEDNCFFRSISCPLPNCTDSYRIDSYKDHIEQVHTLHKKSYSGDKLNPFDLVSAPHVNTLCILSERLFIIVFVKIHVSEEADRCILQFRPILMGGDALDFFDLYCKVSINLSPNTTLIKTIYLYNILHYDKERHCLKYVYSNITCGCEILEHVKMDNSPMTNNLEFITKNQPFSYTVKIHKKKYLECFECHNGFSNAEEIILAVRGFMLCKNCTRFPIITDFCRLYELDCLNQPGGI